MKEMREDRDPIREPRSGSREVAVCIHGENAARANRRKMAPTLWKFRAMVIVAIARDAVAALHDDDYFRPRVDHLLGSDAE